MQEQVNEKISLLIDDELSSGKALGLLQNLREDAELQQRLQRYQLISQVIKNDSCHVLNKSFAEKIHQQIRQEPTYLLGRKKPGIIWQKTALALAASIALAVVWVAYKVDKQSNHYAPQAVMALNIQPVNPNGNLNPHLVDYLQAHDNGVHTNNISRPYRVVGYQQ